VDADHRLTEQRHLLWFLANHSNIGMPNDFSTPLFRSEPNRASVSHPRHIQSLANVKIVACAEPGAPIWRA
jgi:hypothetical protein